MPISRLTLGAAGLLSTLLPAGAFTPTEDGLYAIFTTNYGECVARLHFEEVPLTVANFVGLAEGTLSWVDFQTGVLRHDPFYDGVAFHRVADLNPSTTADAFIIQGGSRDGTGSDDPGYSFPDEIVPSLFFGDGGDLAMANSGPNSNGSQFFFTLGATPWLSGVHSVFGEVVSGLPVLESIAEVERNAQDRPLTPVLLESVEIVRAGAAAAAFDPTAWGLPTIGLLAPEWKTAASVLEYPRLANAHYFFFGSANLTNWTLDRFVETGGTIGSLNLGSRVPTTGAYFVRSYQVTLPELDFRPGKTLFLNVDQGRLSLEIEMGESGGGVYSFQYQDPAADPPLDVQFSSEVSYYALLEAGNLTQVIVEYLPSGTNNLAPTQIYLDFDDADSGTVLMRFLNSSGANLQGTFTFTDTAGGGG